MYMYIYVYLHSYMYIRTYMPDFAFRSIPTDVSYNLFTKMRIFSMGWLRIPMSPTSPEIKKNVNLCTRYLPTSPTNSWLKTIFVQVSLLGWLYPCWSGLEY